MSIPSSASHRTEANSLSENPGWVATLTKFVRTYDGGHRSFLQTFVPSRTPCPRAPTAANAFSEWALPDGMTSGDSDDILDGLRRLVTDFPADRALAFTHERVFLPFPFSAFANDRCEDIMRICVPFPGRSLLDEDNLASWRDVSMIVDVGYDRDWDPFLMADMFNYHHLAQQAARAKNLMLANGLLAAFVVGFYDDVVRIARFDHACAVVTAPLSLRSPADVAILREFFWRFVHPWGGEPGRVVGSDLTMRLLTDGDREWVREQLGADNLVGVVDLLEGRRVEVQEGDAEPRAFILFQLVFITSRIFSRSTMVWRGLEDTRGAPALIQNGLPEIRIIKEAWRRIHNPWEKECYDRLATIPLEEQYGLPGLVCGDDLGSRETRQWQANLRASISQDPSCTAGPLTATFCAVPSAFSWCGGSASGEKWGSQGHKYPPPPFLPYPLHQTFTCELMIANPDWDRSHTRLVVDTVGRPLTTCKSSKELVKAIRDAIRGHRTALEKTGILHCDISHNNILIVDREFTHSMRHVFTGFLHDFDISWMSKVIPTKPSTGDTAWEDVGGFGGDSAGGIARPKRTDLPFPVDEDEEKELEGMGGTGQFFAHDLHAGEDHLRSVHYELEAFYWVLVWMIKLHLPAFRGHMFTCDKPTLFRSLVDAEAGLAKSTWLHRFKPDQIVGNPPLAVLTSAFNDLVWKGLSTNRDDENGGPIRLTYDSVLALFDAAVARTDWPDDPEDDPPSDSKDLSITPSVLSCRSKLDDRVACKRKYNTEEADKENDGLGVVVVEEREAKRCKQNA